MNILTDILSLIKRKKFVNEVKPEDVIVLGINEEPEIEGIASPVPYKDVKLIKVADFLGSSECVHQNVPIGDPGAPYAGVFKDQTIVDGGECFVNLRRLKSLSLDLTIQENGDFIEFDIDVTDEGVWSIPNAAGKDIYYSTISDALTAASSGDTIYLHTNVYETNPVTAILKDGVNINFNGFTYYLDDTSTVNAFTDNNSAVNITLFNGIIKRRSTTVGDKFTALPIYIQSASSSIVFEDMFCVNLNGVGARVQGEVRGLKASGTTIAGISMDDTCYIYESLGLGFGETVGILQDSLAKVGGVYNCIGYSSLSHGISIGTIDTYNSAGYSFSNNGGNGLLLTGRAWNCLGVSTGGSGIYSFNSSLNNCSGFTSVNFDQGGSINFAGILAVRPLVMQNCSGWSSQKNGIGVLHDGLLDFPSIQSCSGWGDVGIEVVLEKDPTGFADRSLTILGSNFIGSSTACSISNLEFAGLDILNSAFAIYDDAGACISANVSTEVKYSNCSFKTGGSSTGTPLVNITQGITNTADNQGNVYI